MAVGKITPLDRVLEIFYSLAAVPVLLGALFKLTNREPLGDAEIWLEVGLYTEALVFLTFAIRYIIAPPKTVDEMGVSADMVVDNTVVTSIDKQAVAEKQAAVAMSNVKESFVPTSAMVGTDVQNNTLQQLTESLQRLEKSLYLLKTPSASATWANTDDYATKMMEATETLANMNNFYKKLSATSEVLLQSADDAQKTQVQMAALVQNLTQLNQIYSSMISAMQNKNS